MLPAITPNLRPYPSVTCIGSKGIFTSTRQAHGSIGTTILSIEDTSIMPR